MGVDTALQYTLNSLMFMGVGTALQYTLNSLMFMGIMLTFVALWDKTVHNFTGINTGLAFKPA